MTGWDHRSDVDALDRSWALHVSIEHEGDARGYCRRCGLRAPCDVRTLALLVIELLDRIERRQRRRLWRR